MARAPLVVLLLVSAGSACRREPLGDGLPANLDCTGCHGQSGDPTPPPAVDGTSTTDSIGVGAHQPHMRGSALAGPVACDECHVLPLVADGTDHPDPRGRPAAVVWGLVATHDSASPVWERATRTCAGTYCHGSTLRGGSERPAPIWTRADGSQVKCDSCHGNPPGGSHPQDDRCELCHGEVVSAGGVITNPSLHVNGSLQMVWTLP